MNEQTNRMTQSLVKLKITAKKKFLTYVKNVGQYTPLISLTTGFRSLLPASAATKNAPHDRMTVASESSASKDESKYIDSRFSADAFKGNLFSQNTRKKI